MTKEMRPTSYADYLHRRDLQRERPPISYADYLHGAAVDSDTIEHFLDPERSSVAMFDPLCGYRLANFEPADGIEGSATICTVGEDGARLARMYTDRPCRIAAYGDSFTQGTQVSDGETWEEHIAARLGEPVRNHGVSGYGVYQAFLRMREVEAQDSGAEYVVLTIWGDDHIRSLVRCRHAAIYPWYDNVGAYFKSNFWSNIEMDLSTGQLRERPNLLPTADSVRRMSDPEFMLDSLRDDLGLQMYAYLSGSIADLDVAAIQALAAALGIEGVESVNRPGAEAIQRILDAYSLTATEWILDESRAFLASRGKKLLVVLLDTERAVHELAAGSPRYDQRIVDFLQNREFFFLDMNAVHVEDHRAFAIPFHQYLRRYVHGHYNPLGNHFFAQSLTPTIVEWLDPKPSTYARAGELAPAYDNYIVPPMARSN